MAPEYIAEGFNAAAVAEPMIALLAFTVVAVLFVVVKWGLPQRSKLKEKQLEIERYRIEVQEKADAALDDRERERIKTTQRQIAAQEESTRAIEALSVQVSATNAQLADSKTNSREMGGLVKEIKGTSCDTNATVNHMATQLDEVHAIVVSRKGAGEEG